MYGETLVLHERRQRHRGLSPHVRGNPFGLPPRRVRIGSIPACTGKPLCLAVTCMVRQVYPRMYGETGGGSAAALNLGGLSPHVRGNRGT